MPNCLTNELEKMDSFCGENKLLSLYFGLTPKCDNEVTT